jgi:hypothetical protein
VFGFAKDESANYANNDEREPQKRKVVRGLVWVSISIEFGVRVSIVTMRAVGIVS